MYTSTEHKVQLIASNQSTQNTLLFVHLSTIRKRKFINQKINLLPLIFKKRGRPNLVRGDLLLALKVVLK